MEIPMTQTEKEMLLDNYLNNLDNLTLCHTDSQ